MRKRQPPIRIDTSWFHLQPSRPMGYWVEVGRLVKKRRIKASDLSAVKGAIREVEHAFRARRQRARRALGHQQTK